MRIDSIHAIRRRKLRAGRWAGAAALLLLQPWLAMADSPVPAPMCALRLTVQVTPDVENPSSGGFLSSLLGDHPGYRLFLLRKIDDTHVELQLQGPGPAPRCQHVVDDMRNDASVLSIGAQ